MNWGEQVLRLDPYLQPTARSLVDAISRFFATHAFARCQFYDSEAAALLGVNGEQLRQAKYELMRKVYICELPKRGNGKPCYGLRLGTKVNNDDEAA